MDRREREVQLRPSLQVRKGKDSGDTEQSRLKKHGRKDVVPEEKFRESSGEEGERILRDEKVYGKGEMREAFGQRERMTRKEGHSDMALTMPSHLPEGQIEILSRCARVGGRSMP